MSHLRIIDRIAIAAMFSTIGLVPLAAHACGSHSSGGARSVQSRVLDDRSVGAIHAGMSAAEVLERLGPPYTKMRFEATKTTSWDYHLRDAWGYDADFSVIIDDSNIVAGKVSVRNGG
jgi:outer membrane protein assembly factor BamE (lipoprotein component of BamABCDE complex)